jgi:hypothetical protein
VACRYRVHYTVDERGLRRAPPCDCGEGIPAIVFFGCSFTYGEGVEDEQTLPYRTGVLTGGRYAVYNFAFHGYGPHQMLAELERGVVASRIEHPPRYAFYSAVPDHVRRAAGRARWDTFLGPRYLLSGSTVRYAGPFKDTSPQPSRRLSDRAAVILSRSAILHRLAPELGEETEAETFAAIVDAARRRFETEFEGAELRVLFWGEPSPQSRDLVERLERRGLVVYSVADILPGFAANPRRYNLPGDVHPNAEAYDLVARFLAERVIADPETAKAAATGDAEAQ